MKNLTIKLSDKDYDLLQRIARADERRLMDLSYLLLARGLGCHFCETEVLVSWRDDEWTEEALKQEAKNEELEAQEGWSQLDWEERKKQGYKPVHAFFDNCDARPRGDTLIQPLADRIAAMALDLPEATK